MTNYTEQQLQKAISHAQKDPTIPRRRIAALYEVNVTTMNRRIAGTQLTRAAAHRDVQLFSPGEEKAIADHCGVMADLGFPVSHDLLRKIAQDMVNSRNQPPTGKGKGKGAVKSHIQTLNGQNFEVHTVGVHWVDRFLRRNPRFKKRYVRYQERARQAASNDQESVTCFLRMLDKLRRRYKVEPEDIWNCDEKGITMGRQQVRRVAIVRNSNKQATKVTEGSREFCSVLDTINAAGSVIPPFIVWAGKTHRQGYYNQDDDRDATFAVSESGYMDDELGMLYISQHFEPHTRRAVNDSDTAANSAIRPRILIVDGHSSHVCWPVVQFALDHNIHLIQLPSKSTHILQPLDVGCFALLQVAYERHLDEWLDQHPFGVIRKVDFLDLLFTARSEVYTVATVKKAWLASGCWPVDIDKVVQPIESTAESATETNIRALDTPLLLRKLARETQQKMLDKELNNGTKISVFQSFVDSTTAKLTTYRDIAPRATTLNKLRSGKTRTTRGPSKQVGSGRVLSRKMLNEGLKKLELAEEARVGREQLALERKLAVEERKNAKQALEVQWRCDLDVYADQVAAWREEVAEIDAAWKEQRDEARIAHKRPPKKPTLPVRPKRPLKPKLGGSDLTVLEEQCEGTIGEFVEDGAHGEDIEAEDHDNEELVEFMRELDLDRFAQEL